MTDKPVVTFERFGYYDYIKYEDTERYYSWLGNVKGHPRLGSLPVVRTSLLVKVTLDDGNVILFDEGRLLDITDEGFKSLQSSVVQIETLNTVYQKVEPAEPTENLRPSLYDSF
jgi:hypothetical protein